MSTPYVHIFYLSVKPKREFSDMQYHTPDLPPPVILDLPIYQINFSGQSKFNGLFYNFDFGC